MEKLSSYQVAALQWLEEHPGQTLAGCKSKSVVTLKDGQVILLGRRLERIKQIYRCMKLGKKYGRNRDLTEEEIEWWSEHGLVWTIYKKDMYRQAALQWLEEHPDKTLMDCNSKLVVRLKNDQTVALGSYLTRIRMIYRAMQNGDRFSGCRNLTKEEIKWWESYGLSFHLGHLSSCVDMVGKYQEAALQWLEENPGKVLSNCKCDEKIVLASRGEVALGSYLTRIRMIYNAMQNGKKYNRCRDLTEEEIAWWSKYGIDWEVKKYRKKECHQENVISSPIRMDFEQKMDQEGLESWIVNIYKIIIKKFDRHGDFSENAILGIAEKVFSEYALTLSEKKILYRYLKQYCMNVKEKNIMRVGRETSEEKKLEKIQKYGLDEFDIEESFFTFLEFEKSLSLKRKYEILKGYIIDWGYYSMEERMEVQRQNGFDVKDMMYIEDTRKSIDELIQKVKELRK